MFFKKLSALAEVLLVLALGNIIGEAIFSTIAPDSLADGTASEMSAAVYSGLLILLRLGLAGVLGFSLLFYRRRITPRQAGLTRNNIPLADLIGQGVVMGLVASFLVALLFFTHSLIPLGNGLPAWWSYSEIPVNGAFVVSLLSTSILIPPLTEEIMTRGYFRVRLVEDYGVMAGVVLTGLVFGLSHTRYLQADGMLLLFMSIILVNSITWTYIAQKTGSIIAPLIAHAVSNGIATAILFNLWVPFVIVTLSVLLLRKPIYKTIKMFFQDWKQDAQRSNVWQGLAIVVTILIFALIMLNQVGRSTTLIALGVFSLVVTIGNLVTEKRVAGRA